jgi:hypothetical protein
VVDPVEAVVGDAAAGFAVVFVVDDPAAVVELDAAPEVVVTSAALVDIAGPVDVTGPEAALPLPPPQAEADTVRTTARATLRTRPSVPAEGGAAAHP